MYQQQTTLQYFRVYYKEVKKTNEQLYEGWMRGDFRSTTRELVYARID